MSELSHLARLRSEKASLSRVYEFVGCDLHLASKWGFQVHVGKACPKRVLGLQFHPYPAGNERAGPGLGTVLGRCVRPPVF